MFIIDYKSRVPLYRQIVYQVERLAARGALPPDGQLPSVRALAMELSINPNTIARAYAELEASGIIYALPARGHFISGDMQRLKAAALAQISAALLAAAAQMKALAAEEAEWLDLCRKAWRDSIADKEGQA